MIHWTLYQALISSILKTPWSLQSTYNGVVSNDGKTIIRIKTERRIALSCPATTFCNIEAVFAALFIFRAELVQIFRASRRKYNLIGYI